MPSSQDKLQPVLHVPGSEEGLLLLDHCLQTSPFQVSPGGGCREGCTTNIPECLGDLHGILSFFRAKNIEGMSDITGTELGRMTARGICQARTVF